MIDSVEARYASIAMQDVCLFAHFDRNDRVADYVLGYIKRIKELHFSIIFISTAKLDRIEIGRLRLDCSDVILRENTGLDFGSWAAGFAKHEVEIKGRLLLVNDSVYGPIGNLATALDRLTSVRADFYGFVESIERTPHLQSWFLLFESWVVQNREFRAVLSQPFEAMTKREIIVNGELGLSKRLVGVGFKYSAIYLTSRSGLAAQYLPFNPTHLLWRELLLCERIPFLKVELLRDNPFGLEDSRTILPIVESTDPSLCRLIKEHLAGSTRKPPRSHMSRCANRLLARRVRRGYHLNRTGRNIAELWNFIGLAPLMVALRVWSFMKAALLSGIP